MRFFNSFGSKYFSPSETGSLPSRSKIEDKYKWDLRDIYQSEDEWESDFKWVEENLSKYGYFVGKLCEGAERLLECLKFDDQVGMKIDRLHLYASLYKDSDMRVTKYQGMDGRIKSLYSKVMAANAFIRPELLSISDEKLLQMIDQNEELRVYRHYIDELLRTKVHTLSKEQEEILALAAEVTMTPYNTYSMFTNADIIFPVVKDDNGNKIEISHARYYAAMFSHDRSYRQRVFKGYFKPYKDYINTFSALFNGSIKANTFVAECRKYSSAREAALDNNNIPVSVYDNLVESTNKNLAPLHRWASLKKKLLGLDEFHPYDVYVTVFPEMNEKKYSYEEGISTVLESLRPMGDEYLSSLNTAFTNRWIDVFETQAKRSGAYSSGTTYGVHPYVLLNWSGYLNDVFTLAHEMGHNMHSYYTGLNQPYPYANYTIFLAEVASTFNEAMLLDYLIRKAESKVEKLYLLEKYLNNITSTFYRQTMFAEFERDVYEKAESGVALTPDLLSDIYEELFQHYWGPDMVIDEEERYTWARIPHFYYNFYVYQYSTGFAASEVLSQRVREEGKPAVEKYLSFLKSGSSEYSINILKKAGVDMNSPDPVAATTRKMNELLDKIESLIV